MQDLSSDNKRSERLQVTYITAVWLSLGVSVSQSGTHCVRAGGIWRIAALWRKYMQPSLEYTCFLARLLFTLLCHVCSKQHHVAMTLYAFARWSVFDCMEGWGGLIPTDRGWLPHWWLKILLCGSASSNTNITSRWHRGTVLFRGTKPFYKQCRLSWYREILH